VSLVGDSIALVVGAARWGEKNLLILGPAGDELVRLGTTCGTGYIDEVLDVLGEIRVIEATRNGLWQARPDLDTLTLERIAEWR
jgi:hypothetical protein